MTPGKMLYSSMALVLILVFLYWSGIAILKFLSQPLSTDIYQTIGDQNGKITFPTITICDFMYAKNHLFMNCSPTSYAYWQGLETCLSKGLKINFSEVTEKLHLKRQDFFSDAVVKYWGDDAPFMNISQEKIWNLVVDARHGPCFSLDLSNDDGAKFLTIDKFLGNPKLEFWIQEQGSENNSTWKPNLLKIHPKYDLPDAFEIHPSVFFDLEDETPRNNFYSFGFIKETRRTVSTKKRPCQEFTQLACFGQKKFLAVAEKYSCNPQVFFSGPHLKVLEIYHDLPPCEDAIVSEIFKDILFNETTDPEFFKICNSKHACHQDKYKLSEKMAHKSNFPADKIQMIFTIKDPAVTHYDSTINYDDQSLVGEVGGTIGLTLGLSFLSLAELLAWIINKYYK